MNKQILNINNLTIGYGKGKKAKVVHEALNAQMFAGELVCLLGENGTGKSTLIRTLCGFQPALGGEATMLGKTLLNLPEKELAKMAAVVLTDRVVVPNATVEELVGLGRSPYSGTFGILNDHDKKVVHESIEKCGILHKKKERLSNMSDGEKQKAFIAKALAQDTPVVILDEPTAFLDMPARVEIIQLLRQIASSLGKSVLMSTHDLDLALQMADRLWLLASDKPLLAGSPEDLLLKNEFQSIFEHRGIEFDNRTGLFRIGYDYKTLLPVQGHGFEYVLLRRAFARKGIKTKPKNDGDVNWLEIRKNGTTSFVYYKNGECIINESCIEKLISILISQHSILEV
nr:ABC transporter ATP-binding protein [uncultured Draconibacterium sp.]